MGAVARGVCLIGSHNHPTRGAYDFGKGILLLKGGVRNGKTKKGKNIVLVKPHNRRVNDKVIVRRHRRSTSN